jgi:cytochrome b6-f complex iron-sulfur subunit
VARRSADRLSRRELLRLSLGATIGLWLAELGAGMIAFLWPSATLALAKVRIGTLKDLIAIDRSIPIEAGFPVYVSNARAFIVVVDPTRGRFLPGDDPTGDGTRLNVRALYQRCPHLGCRPNPCVEDFWFHCPCHQSRYDGHGIKAAGLGPADRGMDRMAIEVDRDGVLTVMPNQITQGPQPVVLGQPGLIPPRVARGCGG